MSGEQDFLELDFSEVLKIPEADIPVVEDTSTDDVVVDDKTIVPKEEELNVLDVLDEQTDADDDPEEDDEGTEDGKAPASTNTQSDSTDKGTPFALVFAKHQLEQGNLSEFDEDEFTATLEEEGEDVALANLFQKEVDLNKEAIKDQYDEYTKAYLDLRENGVDPQKAANSLHSLETLNKITEESLDEDDNAGLRKQLLVDHYKATTNLSDARINKLIDRSIETGDDIEDAKDALSLLKEHRVSELNTMRQSKIDEQAKAQKDYDDQIKNLKTKISSTKEIFEGIKINATTQGKLEDLITKPAKQLENGQTVNAIWSKRAANPNDFDIKLAYLIHTGLFDGKLDMLTKKATTKASSNLKNFLDQKKSSGNLTSKGRTVVGKQSADVETSKGVDDLTRLFNIT